MCCGRSRGVKEKGGMDVGKSNTNNPLDVGVLGSGEGV